MNWSVGSWLSDVKMTAAGKIVTNSMIGLGSKRGFLAYLRRLDVPYFKREYSVYKYFFKMLKGFRIVRLELLVACHGDGHGRNKV